MVTHEINRRARLKVMNLLKTTLANLKNVEEDIDRAIKWELAESDTLLLKLKKEFLEEDARWLNYYLKKYLHG